MNSKLFWFGSMQLKYTIWYQYDFLNKICIICTLRREVAKVRIMHDDYGGGGAKMDDIVYIKREPV